MATSHSWQLTSGSRVYADLRSKGLLKFVAHDRTVVASPAPALLEVPDADALDVEIEVDIPAREFQPAGDDLDGKQRREFIETMRGPKVLAVKQHPEIRFRGRYRGDWSAGILSGGLQLRGKAHDIEMPLLLESEDSGYRVTGVWTGTMRDLGIQPFKAFLGALQLKDWLRLRLDAKVVRAI